MDALKSNAWDRNYHVVFIPKYRESALYGELRRHIEEVFKKLDAQPDRRRAFDARSCAHVDRDPAKMRGFSGIGINQG